MTLIERVQKIISHLTTNLHEREEIVAVALLAAISGQNTFLLGPPGTAKSLIARRISCAFKDANYFEYLMNRFSTPEEVFGPVSIKALKEDKYTRKTVGYLPTSDFAFLDEIWKSSPAILNALLTLVNERIFRNGDKTEKAPLKALISASNETPPVNQGLEALYDRFLVRLFVPPMQERNNFENLLQAKPTDPIVDIDAGLKIDGKEWGQWQHDIHSVKLSVETISVINLIKNRVADCSEDQTIYVSDRRWQRAAALIKTSAFLCGRNATNLSDALLLRHCLWTTTETRKNVIGIVETAVLECGLPTGTDITHLDKTKETLDHDIHQEFYYSDDIYKTVKLNSENYFKITPSILGLDKGDFKTFYIPQKDMNTTNTRNPVDLSWNYNKECTYSFDKQGSCNINFQYSYMGLNNFTPQILFHKGDRKPDVHAITSGGFVSEVVELQKKYAKALQNVLSHKEQVERDLAIPFVPTEIRALAYQSIADQIDQLNLRISDLNRMLALIHADQKLDKAS